MSISFVCVFRCFLLCEGDVEGYPIGRDPSVSVFMFLRVCGCMRVFIWPCGWRAGTAGWSVLGRLVVCVGHFPVHTL